MKNMYTFKHTTGNEYEIHWNGGVYLCVRAFGRDSIVVDKHRTALVSKHTTNVDRFDRGVKNTAENEEPLNWWTLKEGPRSSHCSSTLVQVIEDIVRHHEQHIGKIIAE